MAFPCVVLLRFPEQVLDLLSLRSVHHEVDLAGVDDDESRDPQHCDQPSVARDGGRAAGVHAEMPTQNDVSLFILV